MRPLNIRCTLVATLALFPLSVQGQDLLYELETFTVIGEREEIFELPGSGFLVEADDFRKQGYTNPNRILAKVPGVYVREEDGYGNFPNISIRGGDGTRSEKVTVMEDGILSAPAPYSAPSAYYSPRVARMAGIEVLKGSSQIEYGPQTTGGVINYLSTAIPVENTFYTRNTYGSNNTLTSHSYWGNTIELQHGGRFGYLFELFHQSSDGFRKIEAGSAASGFTGSDDTGFTVTEPMVKLFWEPDTALKQRFEFKYGYTDFEADESYAGLAEGFGGTPNDIDGRPDLRYAGTRFDNIDTKQHRTYLKHLIEFSDAFQMESAIYFNQFERDWFKLDGLLDAGGNDISVRSALVDPTRLDILRSRGEGSLVLRHNAREYESYGIQLRGEYKFATGNVNHTLGMGARYHEDYEDRDQYDEIAKQDADGAIFDYDYRLNNIRRQETEALSFWLKDKIEAGAWTFTPGVRVELIDHREEDVSEPTDVDGDRFIVDNFSDLAAQVDAGTTTVRTNDLSEFIPGISFNYQLCEEQIIFGGVHKGISVPGPRSSVRGTGIEESVGYELGTRYRKDGLQTELVGFFTDFSNILGATAGTGAGQVVSDAGEAEVFGLEAQIAYDPLHGSEMSLPMYVSATWTSAEFKNAIVDGGSDDIFVGAVDGSEIPYVPDFKIAAGVGFETTKFGVNLDATYTSETFGTGLNSDDLTTNPRQGKIDELLLFDLSGRYYLNENVTLVAGVANLFDEQGVVSRIPRGARNNEGRSYYAGFEAKF